MNIVKLQKQAGSCVGFFIGLGKVFFSEGVSSVDTDLVPLLAEKAGSSGVNPRVMPRYAILLWFCLEVRVPG